MPTSRITQRTVTTTMMNGLQSNLGRLQRLQEQLSSGKQVSRPSDSPVQTVEAMQFRGQIQRTEQYLRNADDGLARLATTDQALTSGLDIVRRARELTLGGMNDTMTLESRKAVAAEVDTLRDGLIAVGNTTYLDRPVFGGTVLSNRAYDADGAWVGDDNDVERTIAPDTMVKVNVSGQEVFGPDGELFALLQQISDTLRQPAQSTVSTDLDPLLGRLDVRIDNVITKLGEIGARFNRVDLVRKGAEDQMINLRSSLAEAEDIDLPRTIVDLQMQEVAYKAALGATARVVQPSLLDFLR